VNAAAPATRDGLRASVPPLPRRVLYVQHAGCLGGSATSLRYLVQSMQQAGVECTVALARPCDELVDFYAAAGIATLPAPDICCWDHSTVAPRSLVNPRHMLELAGVAARWRSSMRATLRLVDRVGPDLVHLNSMPLSSSASSLTTAGVPFVWHVREPPPDQGVRTAMIRRLMLAAPACVFITRYDRHAWIGDRPGRIIYNCVPDAWFDRPPVASASASGGPVLFAYVGGFAAAKGAAVLLDALRILRRTDTRWECIMPGCLVDERRAPRRRSPASRAARILGVPTTHDRYASAYAALAPEVSLQPFRDDIAGLFETVDFIVFPATRPHFPRPVIEAAALGRPAVGTDVGGVNECVIHGETGLLCPPDDAAGLAAALEEMIRRPDLRRATGERARARAVAFHTLSAQHAAVAEVYRGVLSGVGSGDGGDTGPRSMRA
jgi:glycosyltransferase involved in cell wall biosynthesis